MPETPNRMKGPASAQRTEHIRAYLLGVLQRR